MDENTILIRSDNATFQIVEGEAILIRMDTGNYYSLNRVATTFWEMLDGESTIGELAFTITRQYNQSSAEFVSELRSLAERPDAADQIIICAMQWRDGQPHESWRAAGPRLEAAAARDTDGDGQAEVLLRSLAHRPAVELSGTNVHLSLEAMLPGGARPTSPESSPNITNSTK